MRKKIRDVARWSKIYPYKLQLKKIYSLAYEINIKAAVQHFSYCTEMMTQFVTFCENLGDKRYF